MKVNAVQSSQSNQCNPHREQNGSLSITSTNSVKNSLNVSFTRKPTSLFRKLVEYVRKWQDDLSAQTIRESAQWQRELRRRFFLNHRN